MRERFYVSSGANQKMRQLQKPTGNRKVPIYLVEGLELRRLLSAQLVSDVDPGTLSGEGMPWTTTVGAYTYFDATDGVHGQRLWRTDGTAAGTAMVDGSDNPSFVMLAQPSVVGNDLYFLGTNAQGYEFYQSDGTLAGTVGLMSFSFARKPTVTVTGANGKVFFTWNDNVNSGLMVTDGTVAGTQTLEAGSSANSNMITGVWGVGTVAYFSYGTALGAGSDLWKTDGTAGGAALLKARVFPRSVVPFGPKAFVCGGDGFWTTDGTAAGTQEIGNLGEAPVNPVVIGSKMYFTGVKSGEYDAWVTDGTVAGTHDLAIIQTNTAALGFVSLNNNVFVGIQDVTGSQSGLFSVGATSLTKVMGFPSGMGPVTVFGPAMYFMGSDASAGSELWKSDGTVGGTARLVDIVPGPDSSGPSALTVMGNKLLFWANDLMYGTELHVSDGTAGGTTLFKDIDTLPNGTVFGAAGLNTAAWGATVGNTLLFSADNHVLDVGMELWKTDGTAGGTALVKDIYPGSGASSPANFLVYNGVLYFTAASSASETGLWRSDGTAAGTYEVWSFPTITLVPTYLVQSGGLMYLGATTGLFVSTGGAPTEVKPGGSSIVNSKSPVDVSGMLYFIWNGGIWRSDGSSAGTTLVAGATPGSYVSVSDANGKVIFNTNPGGANPPTLYSMNPDGSNLVNLGTAGSGSLVSIGTAVFLPGLICSDGTPAGTFTKSVTNFGNIVAVGGELFFAANVGSQQQIWKSDGTLAGTVPVTQFTFFNSQLPLTVGQMFNANGVLIFDYNDGTDGRELWRSDGTAAGTFLLGDVNPGSAPSTPVPIGVIGNKVYFEATEPLHDRELWAASFVVDSVLTVPGGSGNVSLVRDPDQSHIDWSTQAATGQLPTSWANGLTITGNGGNDLITLDYTHGIPLPNTLHLNGTFTINGLQGPNPFSATTMEIGQSTVYVNYAGGPSPAAAILAALGGGYNGGAWNGSGAGASGAITSTAAAGGPANTFGIGYADSVDGMVSGQPANTVEIRYTVMGDSNLDRIVNSTDAVTMARNYLIAGKTAWDLGNFNYDSTINLSDATILQKNFNATASGSAIAAVGAAASVSAPNASASVSSGSTSPGADTVNLVGNDGVTSDAHHKQKVKRGGKERRGR